MKKLSLIFTLLLFFNSCTSDSEENELSSLIGNWVNTGIIENSNFSQSLLYNFKSDKTFIVSTVIIDNTTTEIMGYRYRGLGTYTLNKNILVLNLLKKYIHDDSTGLFSNINDLELSDDSNRERINFSLNQSLNELTFQYAPCEPNENCIASQTFLRTD